VSDWFHVDLSGTAELAQFVPLGRAIKTALFIKNVVSTILSGENPRAKMQRQGQGEVQSWVEQIGELLGRDWGVGLGSPHYEGGRGQVMWWTYPMWTRDP